MSENTNTDNRKKALTVSPIDHKVDKAAIVQNPF